MNSAPQSRTTSQGRSGAGHNNRGERFTRWYNPLQVKQRVVIHDQTIRMPSDKGGGVLNHPQPLVVEFPPQTEVELSSRYDSAIHTVDCGADECKKVGSGWCTKPHEHAGMVIGGGAPQMRRVGSKYTMADVLDPTKAAIRELDRQAAETGDKRATMENRQLVADARRRELDEQQAQQEASEAAYQKQLADDEAKATAALEAATKPDTKPQGKR